MNRQDASEFERDLGSTLEGLAPLPAAGLLDRTMAEVVATPQRSGWRTWTFAGADWPRWLAFGAVAAMAMVIGVFIGSSRGLFLVGDQGSPTPVASTSPSSELEPTPSPRPTVVPWVEPASYWFVFSSDCGERNLIGAFRVLVEDGTVIGYEPLDERAATFPGGIDDMPTIGQLIALEQEASLDDEAIVSSAWDATDGHPKFISIDWLPNAVDDEECYRITRYGAYPDASPPSAGPAWTEPDSYTYVFDSQCGLRMLNGRFEATVEDGRVVAYRSLAGGGSPPDLSDLIPTLGELRHLIQLAREDDEAVIRAYEVDPEDGHPTRIDIDWLPNAIDDEECYFIESYTPTD